MDISAHASIQKKVESTSLRSATQATIPREADVERTKRHERTLPGRFPSCGEKEKEQQCICKNGIRMSDMPSRLQSKIELEHVGYHVREMQFAA